MGRPTGFLEYPRATPLHREPRERLRDWREFKGHLPEESAGGASGTPPAPRPAVPAAEAELCSLRVGKHGGQRARPAGWLHTAAGAIRGTTTMPISRDMEEGRSGKKKNATGGSGAPGVQSRLETGWSGPRPRQCGCIGTTTLFENCTRCTRLRRFQTTRTACEFTGGNS